MSSLPKSIPDNSCAYEEYDPLTLEPANDSTYTRLMELGWHKEEFHGKSVLDIGGNSGILSLYANSLGATDIQYIDVQTPLVEFFKAVVSEHKLPIDITQKGFLELDSTTDSRDIVLCMEVLHWLVDQGGNIPDSIAKLATLTNDTLYIETPWDIREPSIALRGVVLEEDYNIESIVRELQAHFDNVQLVRFMTYFGVMKNSRRILIKATGKRNHSTDSEASKNAINLAYSLSPVAA